jgi:hypothetical protein
VRTPDHGNAFPQGRSQRIGVGSVAPLSPSAHQKSNWTGRHRQSCAHQQNNDHKHPILTRIKFGRCGQFAAFFRGSLQVARLATEPFPGLVPVGRAGQNDLVPANGGVQAYSILRRGLA